MRVTFDNAELQTETAPGVVFEPENQGRIRPQFRMQKAQKTARTEERIE